LIRDTPNNGETKKFLSPGVLTAKALSNTYRLDADRKFITLTFSVGCVGMQRDAELHVPGEKFN